MINKKDLYYIVDGHTGAVVAAGLKKNFEAIVDAMNGVETSLSTLNAEQIQFQEGLTVGQALNVLVERIDDIQVTIPEATTESIGGVKKMSSINDLAPDSLTRTIVEKINELLAALRSTGHLSEIPPIR